jgi:lipopolysaccharide/colanic/teichoic acid biosynthesis glycosyltransferase
VDALPLLRLTEPRLTGGSRIVRGVVDKVGAALLLVTLAPLLLAIFVAVRMDGGPAFFR